VEREIGPWVLDGVTLGARVLELGPGFGAATDLLRDRVAHLSCLEVDLPRGAQLASRLRESEVDVVCGDASSLPFAPGVFDAVVCVAMLHHLPCQALQDTLFRDVARALRPGGRFAGYEAAASPLLRLLHVYDTFVPVPAPTLADRLGTAGFTDVVVTSRLHGFTFRARRVPLS
jgi:SAM-dependent methyltransferase